MNRLLLAFVLLPTLSGCSRAVPIHSAYGEIPDGTAIRDLALLTVRDLRGRRVGNASRTVTVDLPDTATTTTTYGSSTSWSTTSYEDNEVEITTGNTLGSSFVEDVDEMVASFAGRSPAFGRVPIVDVGTLVAMDDRSFTRLAKEHKVRRVAWLELSAYEFDTDTQAKAMTWAYLGGLTLGLALPFLPLERWNASISLGGDVYLWELGEGISRRAAFEETYYQRGPGVPGYNRVLRGVSSWADTRIAEDLLEAYARLAS